MFIATRSPLVNGQEFKFMGIYDWDSKFSIFGMAVGGSLQKCYSMA